MTWHIITGEYPPAIGGVSSYTEVVAEGLAAAGDAVHVWCPAETETGGGGANGITVHRALGRLSSSDLRRAGREIDSFPAPRHVLVQWVPHAFGYRSMNVGFCLWLWRRARRGDRVDIMVHEPYFAFGEGGVRWTAAALVHRLMTAILARAACRVWLSIPAWEERWRPYFFGRDVPMAWLPVPSTLPPPESAGATVLGRQHAGNGGPVVGYLGSYGSYARETLGVVLPHVLKDAPTATAILLGRNSVDFSQQLIDANPTLRSRIVTTGPSGPSRLASLVQACDLMIQPYPDGISSRRTSAMAALALGVPIVSTSGHLTETIWAEHAAVVLAPVGNHGALAAAVLQLLSDDRERRCLGDRGLRLYAQRFAPGHTITALRRAAEQPCASPS